MVDLESTPEKVGICCPRCGKTFGVGSDILGKSVRCPCTHVFVAALDAPAILEMDAPPSGPPMAPPVGAGAGLIPPVRPSRPAPPGAVCRQHPQSPAAVLCQICGAPTCVTCDFAITAEVHLCPTCMVSEPRRLSSLRKVLVGLSLAMAVWSSGFMGCLFGGVIQSLVRRLGALGIGYLLIVPVVVGLALSIGGFERRVANPPIIWVAAIWNVVLTIALLLLTFVGATR